MIEKRPPRVAKCRSSAGFFSRFPSALHLHLGDSNTSCYGTARHSARRIRGSNQQPSSYQSPRSTPELLPPHFLPLLPSPLSCPFVSPPCLHRRARNMNPLPPCKTTLGGPRPRAPIIARQKDCHPIAIKKMCKIKSPRR